MKYLLSQTSARYSMLLSDEDRIDASGIQSLLNFLDELSENVKVVSCSIFDEDKNEYYAQSLAPSKNSFGRNSYLVTGMPVPSYISGLIFSTSGLRELNLEKLYAYSMGNAYPHLDVVSNLLDGGLLTFYKNKIVLKGARVAFGGEGFEHRLTQESLAVDNLDLNPLVYGPKARARQFFYQEKIISDISNAKSYPKCIARMFNFTSFYGAIKNSGNVTILEDGCDIREEVAIARNESIAKNEYSYSFFAIIFASFILLPWPVGTFICSIATIILRMQTRLAWFYLRVGWGDQMNLKARLRRML